MRTIVFDVRTIAFDVRTIAFDVRTIAKTFQFWLVVSDAPDPCFYDGSDIDLAVWGVDDRSFFKAVGVLQGLSEFAIDLVMVDDRLLVLPPYILEAIVGGMDL